MRNVILFTIAVLLLSFGLLSAQTISPTGSGAASGNPPTGWGVSGLTSNVNTYSNDTPWALAPLPAAPSGQGTFLTLLAGGSTITNTSTTIKGLQTGWTYEIHYNIMTAKSTLSQAFASAAEVGVDAGTSFDQHTFPVKSAWISGNLQFTASSSTATLYLKALGTGGKAGLVNLDIAANSIKVVCGINPQVALSKSSLYNACFQPFANLNDAFTGTVPQGWSLVWFNNATHSGFIPIAEPNKVTTSGDYYAFFYNGSCYNTNNSTAKVTVNMRPALPGNGQVQLNKTNLTNACPATKVNLNDAFTGNVPAGTKIIWFSNANHTGWPVLDPTQITQSGDYYAFFYDQLNDCYNTDNSTSKVTVITNRCAPCNAGTAQVSLTGNTKSNVCPVNSVNLNKMVNGLPPSGTSVVWFSNAAHTGSPIASPTQVAAGTYYAFFYDAVNKCYNTSNSTASVVVSIVSCCNAGTAQVSLAKNLLFVNCATGTVNLNDAFNGQPIPGSLVWFANNLHAGSPIANPAPSGTYYAFIWDAVNNCYNTDKSTAVVDVLPGEQQVQLGVSEGLVCAPGTFNLSANLVGTAPIGSSLRWFTNPNHNGNFIADPTQVSDGTYYAFFYYASGNCQYNTDNSTSKIVVQSNCEAICNAGTAQVILSKTELVLGCATGTVDLKNAFNGVAPASLVWYTNASHSGSPIVNPSAVSVGTYYAFIWDAINNCYNTDNSTAILTVLTATQVSLSKTEGLICAPATFDLLQTVSGGTPIGASLRWFTNPNHTGDFIADPTQVSYGTYYAFFKYELGSCQYNTDNSTAKIVVKSNCAASCNAGTDQVPLDVNVKTTSDGKIIKYCPSALTDLNSFFLGSVPQGSTLVWFNNDKHKGSPVDPMQAPVSPSGNYVSEPGFYAFFYDSEHNCYNTDLSTSLIQLFTNFQVVTTHCNDYGLCPNDLKCGETFDLTSVIKAHEVYDPAAPNGIFVRWFDNNTHSGQPIADPTAVGPGSYYAFYYDSAKDCYNKAVSTAYVDVTDLCNTQLGVKVALQGSMPNAGTTMRNDLQNYFGEFLGLLPSIDPYNGGANYPNIGNPTAAAGAIVDWVKVEIRSAANPATILETKSLLLKTDGSIVDVNGAVPSFTPQVGNVHVVVKHRNHVAIMSQPIGFASGSVGYDFTGALSQASNAFGDPSQMVLKNGVWCMWAGDVNANQDFSIDGVDGTLFNVQFKLSSFDLYETSDLNMDGAVDGVDGTLFNNNFNVGYYSTILNY